MERWSSRQSLTSLNGWNLQKYMPFVNYLFLNWPHYNVRYQIDEEKIQEAFHNKISKDVIKPLNNQEFSNDLLGSLIVQLRENIIGVLWEIPQHSFFFCKTEGFFPFLLTFWSFQKASRNPEKSEEDNETEKNVVSDLRYTAVKCFSEIIIHLSHFNYSQQVITFTVKKVTNFNPKVLPKIV